EGAMYYLPPERRAQNVRPTEYHVIGRDLRSEDCPIDALSISGVVLRALTALHIWPSRSDQLPSLGLKGAIMGPYGTSGGIHYYVVMRHARRSGPFRNIARIPLLSYDAPFARFSGEAGVRPGGVTGAW